MSRRLGSNILWNSIGTIFYFGCQWLLTVLVVRLNGNYSDAGVLSLGISIATPLATVASLNLRTAQVANMDQRFSDGDFIVTRAVTTALALALCIIVAIGSGYTLYTALCVVLFTAYRLSEAVVDVLHGIDQRVWRLDLVGKSFLIRGGLMLAVFVVGEYFFQSLPLAIILMGVVVYGVIFFYDVPACRGCTQLNLNLYPENFFPLIKIGVPLGAFSFLLTLLSSLPRLFMEHWHGADVLGVFSSIATITSLVPQLANFIFAPLIPLFAERWKAGNIKGFNGLLAVSTAAAAAIGAAALLGGALLGEWGLCLIFGESIQPYSYLLCPVIGTAILTAYLWLLGTVLTVTEDYNALALLSLVSVVGTLIASVYLIPGSVFWGTIWATAVGLSIELVLLGFRTAWIILKKKRIDC